MLTAIQSLPTQLAPNMGPAKGKRLCFCIESCSCIDFGFWSVSCAKSAKRLKISRSRKNKNNNAKSKFRSDIYSDIQMRSSSGHWRKILKIRNRIQVCCKKEEKQILMFQNSGVYYFDKTFCEPLFEGTVLSGICRAYTERLGSNC